MLNALSCFGNGLLCKRSSVASCVFGPQAFSAYISTNTAINKSLRKSQRSGRELKRRPSSRQGTISKYDGLNNPFSRNDTQIFDGPNVHGRTERPKGHHRIDIGIRVRGYEAANPSRGSNARGNPFEKIRRPNHQEGMDVEDMESPSIKKSQGMQRLHRSTLRRNENGEFDRSTRGAQYDYKEHPEGNRASRRVIKFGRPVERLKPSESHSTTRQSNHRQTSYGNNYRSSGNDRSSRTSEQRHASQKYNRLTIPEALQDDLEASSNTARSHFTMGRQTDRIDSAKNVSQTWDSDHEPLARANSNFKGYGRASFQRDDSEPPFRQSNVPLSIPYTTSASEFLYGTSVVSAALLSSRRKLYKLYIYSGDNREVGDQDTYIRNLALSRGVVVERVKGDWLRLMDKMSTGRPHNVRYHLPTTIIGHEMKLTMSGLYSRSITIAQTTRSWLPACLKEMWGVSRYFGPSIS